MGVQFVSDKENKKVVYNQLKSFTNGGLVYPCTVSEYPCKVTQILYRCCEYVSISVLNMIPVVWLRK